jgi:hypothetical protein
VVVLVPVALLRIEVNVVVLVPAAVPVVVVVVDNVFVTTELCVVAGSVLVVV